MNLTGILGETVSRNIDRINRFYGEIINDSATDPESEDFGEGVAFLLAAPLIYSIGIAEAVIEAPVTALRRYVSR